MGQNVTLNVTRRTFIERIVLENCEPSEIARLGKLSARGWHRLIAEAARKTNGKTSFYPARWRELNQTGKPRVGRALYGHCGVASWLYAAIKKLTRHKNQAEYAIKYYADLQHVTVLCGGKEFDITAPQHKPGAFKPDKSKQLVVIPISQLETFTRNDPHRTKERFKLFVAAVAETLRKQRCTKRRLRSHRG